MLGAVPFRGRPYGGTAIIIKKDLPLTMNVISSLNSLIGYLMYICPVMVLIIEIFSFFRIQALLHAFPECTYLIGGDFNVSLDCSSSVSNIVNNFLTDNNPSRCDIRFPVSYVYESLNSKNCIDYLTSSSSESMTAFNVLDSNVNLSNHLPIIAIFQCALRTTQKNNNNNPVDRPIPHF